MLQYDLNDNFVQEWYGISEASRNLNIQRQDIGKCCLFKIKRAGLFQWSYKNNNNFPLKIERYIDKYNLIKY